MALTNSKDIAEKINRLRAHGITRDKKKMSQRPEDEIWNYQQIELGFNYRMNDIQAALGLNQMKRLDEYIELRHKIAKIYDNEFKTLPITTPWQSDEIYSSYHLYPIRIKNNQDNKSQKNIYHELIKNQIGANLHYTPVHRHPYYENLGFKKNDFPESEKFHCEAISIPIYASLSNKEQKHVMEVLKKVILS